MAENNTNEKPAEPVLGTPLVQNFDKLLWQQVQDNATFAVDLRNELLARINKLGSRGGGGVAVYFASIKSGSGLTYVADIYNKFDSDMVVTGTKVEEDVAVKVPAGALDATFDLTVGQTYPVAQYQVDGVTTWVIIEHVGIS